MFDVFLQIFPTCLLFFTLAMIVTEDWTSFDQWMRRSLAGRALVVGDRLRVVQEDGTPLCDYDIRTYFDELPEQRRF
jgi:hypothetical protein